MGRFNLGVMLLSSFLSVGLLAADLDVAGAKAAYDAQRRVADQAKARLDGKEQILREAERHQATAQAAEDQAVLNRDRAEQHLRDIDELIVNHQARLTQLGYDLQQAQNWVNNVDNQLQLKQQEQERARREIERLDRQIQNIAQKIADLENKPHPGEWECTYVDNGWEEHGGGHKGWGKPRAKAEQEANEACLKVHGTCKQSGCRQDDTPELAELRQRKARLEQERQATYNDYTTFGNQVASLQYEMTKAQNQYASIQQNQQQTAASLAQSQRDREYQVRVVDDANSEVRRARNNTDLARQEVAAARPPYLQAKSDYDYEENLAGQAYAYYQQVVANYNAALNAVYAQADNAAYNDGGREAADRAPAPGASDGDKVGRGDGSAKGKKDGSARDLYKGYLDGRSVGATDQALAVPYKEGIGAGELAARAKAHLESYPKGFNDALKAHFGGLPAQAASVDITGSIGSDPGGNGQFLNLKDLKVGIGQVPAANTPKEPPYGPPAAGSPSVSVPASLKAYFSPPCSGLVLAEFEPLCRSRYENSYLSQFASQYRSIYTKEYRRTYDLSAASSYQTSLAGTDAAAFVQGRGLGAKDQGLLDGFAKAEPLMQTEEYGIGKTTFANELSKGAFLVVRGAKIEETSGDGLFTPGEPVRVSLVIDNYGRQATALGKIRARISGAAGLGTFSVTVRDLPALAADTRTTLTGVVSAPITTEAPGDKIQLDVALDVDAGAGFQEAAKVRTDAETGFPLELTAITLPKNPKVNEKIEAKFKFKNRTTAEITGAKTDLSSSPAFVAFTKPSVQLPAIAAGAEVEVPAEIAPGPWVGDDTYVRFLSQLTFADGRQMKQALRQFLAIDRPISLLLFDGSVQPVPSSTLKVKAGSSFAINVQLKVKSTKTVPGPVVVRAGKISNPLITFGNGSTTSVSYGSVSPNQQYSKIRMIYSVPASLKGKSEYVMVEANDGGKTQHALMVYLDIQ